MERSDHFAPAVGLVLLATFCFAGMDTISKYLVTSYPIAQILCIRYAFFLGFAAWVAGRDGIRRALRPNRPWLLLFTGLLLTLENATFVLAYRYLPIGEVQAVAALAPLVVVALSAPLLGEAVGLRRWLAVSVGLIGVVLIVRPGFTVVTWHIVIPILGTLQWGLYQVLNRKITRTDPPQTMVLWMAAIGLAVMLTTAPAVWVPPQGNAWLLLPAVGVIGSLGHYLLIRALDRAEASGLQPFTYSQFLWSVVLGFLVFTEFPDPWMLAGAFLIICGGLYAWRRGRLAVPLAHP